MRGYRNWLDARPTVRGNGPCRCASPLIHQARLPPPYGEFPGDPATYGRDTHRLLASRRSRARLGVGPRRPAHATHRGAVSKSVSIRHAKGPFRDRKGPLTW